MNEAPSLLDVDEALARILGLVTTLPPECVDIHEAIGRATADDVIASRTVPPWDNSAMDGYAVRSSDVEKTPARLRIVEAIFAGQIPARAIGPGECSRIMTGAPLPEGADAVVMQERTRHLPASGALGEVEVLEPVRARASVRDQGEDARKGDRLLPRGTPLGIPEAALLWSQGGTQISVPRRPRVAIVSTGDELCRPDQLAEGKIVDSNSPALAAATRRAGGVALRLGIAQDSVDEVESLVRRAEGCDAVLTSAGVSVGEHDFVKSALDRLGVRMSFWRVAIKPGKPLAVGQKGATLFFGLPGNPTSSLVSFELFVRPALRKMLGHSDLRPERVRGRSAVELKKPSGLTHFIRATVERREAELWAQPLSSQNSGSIRSAVGVTHLLEFPRSSEVIHAGDPVDLLPISWRA